MREHPIPQDITGYRFHLVGNMTLKQFAEILLGVVLAFIMYKSGLPGIFRWPLIILFAGTGALAAFVPFEERPLDHWITTYFKVLFKPTKFFWRRKPKIPDLFFFKPQDETSQINAEVDLSPARKNRIYQYLQSIHYPSQELDQFEIEEQQRVGALLSAYPQIQVQQTAVTTHATDSEKPNLKVRVRQMQKMSGQQEPVAQQTITQSQQINSPQAIAKSGFEKVASTNSQQEIEVAGANPQQEIEELHNQDQQINSTQREKTVLPPPPKIDEPFPLSTTQLNQIGGNVLSYSGDLINEALVEIKDENQRTITATNTNPLGQFLLSADLKAGTYTLQVNSPELEFEPIEITLDGNEVEPIEIRSKPQ